MQKRKKLIFEWMDSRMNGRISGSMLRSLNFLLQDEDDVNVFWREYTYSKLSSYAIVMDFRRIQRIRKWLSQNDFLDHCSKNKKAALEKLFQEPLTNDVVGMLDPIDKPLGEVYQLSIENPILQLHSLLKFWGFVKSKDKISSFEDSLDD